ncbi:Zn2/Cys6 DNA-binding protein [Glarea lozoyensis ATCC 20868]|uniref:Zn2/Cys6 DNA-binding protein n=1 Tax=Glarea lozoyensis (strain ATCC 20868 / MF5171) TaxID=1116229 RepID=S3ECL4_GLAL2|nr:Zn2/Cys6 DNA-binding protein [Glarea lozoyensis ATCC 20868]EPE36048.1 Zn2/Cys6 DNA-binding protein [Glarea lozoyensis ATCC 20868]
MFTHSNPVALRSHKKSQGGCKSCKERRVKCDEVKPLCGKCAVHYVNIRTCEWTAPKPRKSGLGKTANALKPKSSVPTGAKSPLKQNITRQPTNKIELTEAEAGKGKCKQHCPCHDPIVTTLSTLPTSIHSQYCTNPLWLTTAISSPTLFSATLYVCSMHRAGLDGKRDTAEALWYKSETIRLLNESLREEGGKNDVTDETIAAVVLLTHVLAVVGLKSEVDAHIKRIQLMVKTRGGINNVAWNSMLLHMLCTTNHITAVLSDDPIISAPATDEVGMVDTHQQISKPASETAEVFPEFAARVGFHKTMVSLLQRMGFLYGVVDVFTQKFIPAYRDEFLAICL